MPFLLLREDSKTSLSTLVDKAQKKSLPLLEYDLQLNNGHLDLVLLSKPDRKINSTSSDEGFESDIDSLSIVSNDSFSTEKRTENGKTAETDSANGSSSSDSDTEVLVTKKSETNQPLSRTKESFNLVECVCYTDVSCTDILIFVIKTEALVFKFENISHLKTFYTNFTTLKAVANQNAYNKQTGARFNLLQDQNGVMHLEITKESSKKVLLVDGPSSIISIDNPPADQFLHYTKHKPKKVNSRQRTESQYINDLKYNTLNSKLGPKASIITKSNSIENILDLDQKVSNLVNKENLRKVWNSAEDLLEPPKRPERRKKGRAPQPPPKTDVFSGQYVRVNVNFDPVRDLARHRLLLKSAADEPHPRKLQNFNVLSTKPSITSFLRSKDKEVLKYEPRKDANARGVAESSWSNSVPRLLRKQRSKSETRNFVPMAYRYIDTTQDYPLAYNTNSASDKPNGPFSTHGSNLTPSHYLRGDTLKQNINNRLFGLSSKLREFSGGEDCRESKWETGGKDSNLKSVIKNNRDDNGKKKNEKKVTFSAYTTVQVV